jgi:hypothetical protein
MRRRTAKVWALVGLMFVTLIVVGYGPWSSWAYTASSRQ